MGARVVIVRSRMEGVKETGNYRALYCSVTPTLLAIKAFRPGIQF
jgi:hypothetical protein